MKAVLLLLAATASLGIADHPSFARRAQSPEPVSHAGVSRRSSVPLTPVFQTLFPDTFVLAEYDFAGLDPQGWTTHDITAQADTFFHVDDFAGVTGYAPLSGTKSMWCGTNTGVGQCPYPCTPGYGNGWDQRFESVAFPATGDVTLSFQIRYDSEPGYDRTYVQYFNASDYWSTLATYDDAAGPVTASFVIPAANLPGTVKIRFRFTSDGYWSDEDCDYESNGAVVIDDISISDATGLLDFQDFEVEPVGARVTADGDWAATVLPGYGTLAALYPGTSVLQEDPNHYEIGAVWGFFADPPPPYPQVCPGQHAEQGVIPYGNAQAQYLRNEIHSPVIAWNEDENGAPVPATATSALFEADVYRDNPLDDMIVYYWRVRSFVDGCPQPWQDSQYVYYGGLKEWYRPRFDIAGLVDPAASHVQVALSVVDACGPPFYWSSCALAYVKCHTHAPLFTNVRVVRVDEGPTGVGESPALARLEQNIPNPFNPATEIRYTIPHSTTVSLIVYDVTGAIVRRLVSERQEPRAGGHAVTWDGRDERGSRVASGVYYYRLVAGEFTRTRKMVLLK